MGRVTVGALVIAVGVLHELVGVALGWEHLVDIAVAGGFNTVTDDQPWRMAIFWFEAFGLLLALVGMAWHHVERQGLALPRSWAIGLALVGLIGVFFMPASGFWTVFPLAALAWWRGEARRRREVSR